MLSPHLFSGVKLEDSAKNQITELLSEQDVEASIPRYRGDNGERSKH